MVQRRTGDGSFGVDDPAMLGQRDIAEPKQYTLENNVYIALQSSSHAVPSLVPLCRGTAVDRAHCYCNCLGQSCGNAMLEDNRGQDFVYHTSLTDYKNLPSVWPLARRCQLTKVIGLLCIIFFQVTLYFIGWRSLNLVLCNKIVDQAPRGITIQLTKKVCYL